MSVIVKYLCQIENILLSVNSNNDHINHFKKCIWSHSFNDEKCIKCNLSFGACRTGIFNNFIENKNLLITCEEIIIKKMLE